nr:hypothetical protein [Tanacetum cinerariifolium]
DNKHVNDLLTAELERYRSQERVLNKLKHDETTSTSYESSQEIESLKHTLSEHLKEKESLEQNITILKNDFQKEESRNIDRELALEKLVKELNNIVLKRSQSAQTVHMLTKPEVFYNHSTRHALGFQNPCYLKKAQQLKPNLYDGRIIKKSDGVMIFDTEETLMLVEESRSKMIEKQKDPQMTEKKVITKPVNYAIVNQLSTDFETRFVPQIELSAEQAFWSQYPVQIDEPNLSATTTIVEVLKELPKVSMVNSCLKKLKSHLASFDMVVKERTTATAITKGTWGFEHTKVCFRDDIISFVKALKELFTSFDQYLIDEVTGVQYVFKQMELAVEQHRDVTERNVKREVEEIETLNIELDHKVTKLVAENEHLKQTYKQLYDSIKSSHVRSKEQCDDLVNKVNLKSAEVSNLNAGLQEKVLTKSWLRHRRLSHLNFGAINHLARQGLVRGLLKLKFEKDHLCSACAMGKSTKKTHKPKSKDTNQEKLYLLHMDLCGPMRVESVNGKKYTLVIVDDYSGFTWVKFMRSKDETPMFIIKFLKMIQVRLNVPVRQAVATACFTQYRSIIRLRHGKTPYELLNSKLPNLLFFHVFGALCYPTNDNENLGKLQPKADIGIFIGYAPSKKAFRIYNRRTRRIVETIHEEVGISHETSVARSPQQNGVVEKRNHTLIEAARTMLIYAQDPLFLWAEVVATVCFTQNRSIIRLRHGKTSYELLHSKLLDLSFFHVFGALCYPTNDSENLDAPSPSKSLTPTEIQSLVILLDVGNDNLDMEVAHMGNDPLLGVPFLEVSSDQSSSTASPQSNVQPNHPMPHHNNKWTKDHPLNNIIGQLSRPVSTRLQLHEQALFCYYDAFLTSVEPKTYKEALTQACWIEAIQEELNEFERLE